MVIHRSWIAGISIGAVAAGLMGAQAARADDLFIGGPQGPVMRADPASGDFTFGGVCGGPVVSMTQIGEAVVIGDVNGNVYRLQLDGGNVDYYFTVAGSDNSDIVADGAQLLISTTSGLVRRVNPQNGAVLATYTAPIRIRALLVHEGFLYAAGPDAAGVYRAPLATGQFTYFACVCFGPANDLAVLGEELLVVDEWGTVAKFNLATGEFTGTLEVPGDNTAMVVHDGQLVISDSAGNVRRVDPETGEVLSTRHAPVEIRAMALTGGGAPPPPPPGCAADLNLDGTVGSEDFFMFLGSFFNGSMQWGDWNGDGAIGSADFFAFMADFFAACR